MSLTFYYAPGARPGSIRPAFARAIAADRA